MKKTVLFCIWSILCTTLSTGSSQQLTEQKKDEYKNMSIGLKQFSLTLLLRIAIDIGDENFVISPFSVWMMLTVLSEGAKDHTLYELSTILRHPRNNTNLIRQFYDSIEKTFIVKTSSVELASTNHLFIDSTQSVTEKYQNLVQTTYDINIDRLDFKNSSAVNNINQIISQDTRGKITRVVNRDDLFNSKMILTNAAFFKAKWSLPFNASETRIEDFFNFQNQKIGRVNMMHQRGVFSYVNMPEFQARVIELPFGKEKWLSMIVMLPHYRISLMETFKKFTKLEMKKIMEALEAAAQDYDGEVDVYLPRFEIETDFTLNGVLNNMGINDVFDPNYSDLSGISSDGKLYLSRVIHKAVIEVNEEGVHATEIEYHDFYRSNFLPKISMNKPFLYFIYDKKSDMILLCGTYKTPSLA